MDHIDAVVGQARLNRAYRPAVHYLSGFNSTLMSVVARNVVFLAGAVLAVLVLLTIYDEDVITVEHVLTIMTILGAVVAGTPPPPCCFFYWVLPGFTGFEWVLLGFI